MSKCASSTAARASRSSPKLSDPLEQGGTPTRDRLFEPFQRLGDTDNATGLGLGLALSKGLAEAMNGTLVPEDTPGGGLTMVLSLPFADRAEHSSGTQSTGGAHEL